jgi:hypothetical protein
MAAVAFRRLGNQNGGTGKKGKDSDGGEKIFE